MKSYINKELEGLAKEITIACSGRGAIVTLLTSRNYDDYSEMRLAVVNALDHLEQVKGQIIIENDFARLIQVSLSKGLPDFIKRLSEKNVINETVQKDMLNKLDCESSNWSPKVF